MEQKLKPAQNIVILKDFQQRIGNTDLVMAEEDKKNKPEMGLVVAIGKGEKPIPFKKGDTIVYGKYTDNKISVGGVVYNFIEFKNIMAVIET